MSVSWQCDDPSGVPKNETLYRRVLRHPNFIVPNLTTKVPEPSRAALQFDEGDGLSVHQESLREALGVEKAKMYDWDRYHAIEFSAETVRGAESGGVVHEDDPDDDVLGKAHALVRTTSGPKMPKGEKDRIRYAIIAAHNWVDEDPNCPTRPPNGDPEDASSPDSAVESG